MRKSFSEFFNILLKIAVSIIIIGGLLTLILMAVGVAIIFIIVAIQGGCIT